MFLKLSNWNYQLKTVLYSYTESVSLRGGPKQSNTGKENSPGRVQIHKAYPLTFLKEKGWMIKSCYLFSCHWMDWPGWCLEAKSMLCIIHIQIQKMVWSIVHTHLFWAQRSVLCLLRSSYRRVWKIFTLAFNTSLGSNSSLVAGQ